MTGSWVRTRSAAIGAAVAVSLGAGGIGLVRATTSSGERAVFVPMTPCRLADLRAAPDTVGPRAAALAPEETLTLPGRGTVGNCTLPSEATALSLNVTAVAPTEATYLTLFPSDAARPLAASLNPTPGQPPTPNAVTVDLDATGRFSIYNFAGRVAIVIDVVGYYADHDHDDRYATKAEVDAAIAAATAAAIAAARPVAYAAAERSLVAFAAGANSLVDVTTLSLPAGAYVVAANVVVNNDAATTSTLACTLLLGSSDIGDTSDQSFLLASNGVAGEREALTLNGAGTLTTAGGVRLVCRTGSTSGNYLGGSIVATAVGSVTGP